MAKVGKVVAGVALVITGAIVGLVTQNWGLAYAIASTGVGILTMPKIPKDLNERQGAVLENRVGSLERLPVVYGITRIGAVFADVRVDNASPERKRLVVVPVFCHGSRDGSGVTAIQEVWFDDRRAVNGSTVQSPFNTLPAGQIFKHLEFEHHLGSTTQVVDSRLTALFPVEWPATSRGRGVCYSRMELWFNPDIYTSGLPTIQAKIAGNKVFDPRDATWKHSTNPALCIRDYMLSPIYGLGIEESALEEQSFIDMANYCDELVLSPSGPAQKRFEMNGWVDTSRSVEQNLVELCTSCRGQIINEGDKWRLVIRRQRAVSGFKINEDNTVEGSWQFILPGSDGAPNVGRASYIDPSRDYDVDNVQWPEPGQVNVFLADDNAFEQRLEIDLPFTDNRVRAQQIVMTLVKESREAIGVICTLRESALQVRVGDLVEVTYPTPGWVDKVFDVAALLLSPDATMRAVLVEYEPTVYDLDTQFAQPEAQDTNLPNPFVVAEPTSLVLVSSGKALQTNDGRYIPRIQATWGKSNDPFVDYYEIQAKKNVDSIWDHYGRIGGLEDALFFVYPVTDEQWDVRISAVNTLGKRSNWISASHLVVTPDPRPQILSITLTNAHADSPHTDVHTDLAHGDAAHSDAHTDTAHSDHTDHGDAHGDSGAHDDVAHGDTYSDNGQIIDHVDSHGDNAHGDHSDGHGDSHTDTNHIDTAHSDSYSDNALIIPHEDVHSDVAHGDHSDTNESHTDGAHVDSHTDTSHADSAHGDGHVDVTHVDGQHGVGIAIQADTDSSSVKAVARKVSANLVLNGSGEEGTVGAAAPNWTQVGNGLLIANDFAKVGGKSLKIVNAAAADSYGHQDFSVLVGVRYRLAGWVKTSALPTTDSGDGAYLNINIVSGVTGYTIVEKFMVGSDPSPTQPDVGIRADNVAHDWTYIFCRFIPTGANGVLRVHAQLGYGGLQSGTAWFDDIRVEVDEPSAADVRTQQAADGRNVVLELIDAATGAQIQMNPGDRVRVGAIAYSEPNAGGVEGPLALASVGLFTVAPVGTDKWVPT